MRLSSLVIRNVRTHSKHTLNIYPDITLITGMNGSGKTSLLEAIYISLQGSSFKGSDNEILKFGSPWYRIDIKDDNGTVRTVKFDPSRSSGKKQFEIDSKTHYRLSYANKYPIVLFEPDELRLINGSPSRRRGFIDRLISQIDPEYAQSLSRYERSLKQRNILLKNKNRDSDLFVWDVSLSKYGAYIIRRRQEILNDINTRLETVYRDIAQSKDKIEVLYSAHYKDSVEQRLLSELHQSVDRDRVLGYTSVGPHRHDIEIKLNTRPAENAASRGEVRTVILALKFLEVDIIREATNKNPVILLDDVFSELDEMRQGALLNRFSKYQTIITSVAFPSTSFPVHQLSS